MSNYLKKIRWIEKIRFILSLVILLSIVMGVGTMAVAEPELKSSKNAESENLNGVTVDDATQKIQVIKFQSDLSLRDALSILAMKFHRNIVPTPLVDGTVTARVLYDVTFEEAMDALLKSHQLKWEDDGKIVWVYTAEEYQAIKFDETRMENKYFTLYYITAEEAKKLLEAALSDNGLISATTASKQNTEAGDGGDSFAMRDAILVYDFPERIEKISEMITEIDVRPPAIMLEVTIMQAVLNDETDIGVDLGFGDGDSLVSSLVTNDDDVLVGNFSGFPFTGGVGASFSLDNLTAFMTALESVTDTTILANPKIMALNKQAGRLQIGGEEGYASVTSSNADGATQEVEFLETGTILEFRPFICKNGYIRMELYPEQSTGQVRQIGSATLPTKQKTTVKTNIMVKDGKTIVIGGLFQDDIQKTRTQIPILGDLPFIGMMFRGTNDTAVRTELIIMITPHIIHDPDLVDDSEDIEKIARTMHGAHKSLPWINRRRLMEDRYAWAVKDYIEGNYDDALSKLNWVLDMRPNYENALKLREDIIIKTNPDDDNILERIMLEKLENSHIY